MVTRLANRFFLVYPMDDCSVKSEPKAPPTDLYTKL